MSMLQGGADFNGGADAVVEAHEASMRSTKEEVSPEELEQEEGSEGSENSGSEQSPQF